MAIPRSSGPADVFHVVAVDRNLACRCAGGAPAKSAARGGAGRDVGLALLGAGTTRRRHGLVRSRALYLNETGDPRFDAITIEHNGILAPCGQEQVVFDSAIAWFAELGDIADELYISGSAHRLSEKTVEGRGLGRTESALPSYSVDLGLLS